MENMREFSNNTPFILISCFILNNLQLHHLIFISTVLFMISEPARISSEMNKWWREACAAQGWRDCDGGFPGLDQNMFVDDGRDQRTCHCEFFGGKS